MKRLKIGITLLCLLAGVVGIGVDYKAPTSAFASPPTLPSQIEHSPDLTAGAPGLSGAEFQAALVVLRAEIEKSDKEPEALEIAIRERINRHLEISDSSVETAVNAWSGYEGSQAVKPGTLSKDSFLHTLDFIDALAKVSGPFATRAAWLHQKKAEILQSKGDMRDAGKEFGAAVDILTPVGTAIALRRVKCLVGEGDSRMLGQNPAGADPAYLEALSFDWFKIGNPDAQNEGRDLYIAAGRGIIDIRRGNLQKLMELHFVPSTLDELGPPMDAAITEATKQSRN